MARLALNFILFQAGWFACVLGAAAGKPAIGVVTAVGIVALHLKSAQRAMPEAGLVLTAMLIGAIFDSLLAASGWLVYASPGPADGLAPTWIIALWACFATALNVSLRWLRGRLLVAALFGLLGGPVAYLAGASLGGVQFADRGAALIALGIGWAVVTPLLMKLAERFDGWPETAQRSRTLSSIG